MEPSNFRNDPAGHLGNQCGHIVIGIAADTLLGPYGAAPVVIAVVALCYWIGWELGVQGWRLYWDSAEDAAYVTAGAAFQAVVAMGQGPGMVISIGIGLAAGALLRR